MVAKVRISANNPIIDLTPLAGRTGSEQFALEIDGLSAKLLNGKMVEVIFGAEHLQHRIAHQSGVYRIDVDFQAGTIDAVH